VKRVPRWGSGARHARAPGKQWSRESLTRMPKRPLFERGTDDSRSVLAKSCPMSTATPGTRDGRVPVEALGVRTSRTRSTERLDGACGGPPTMQSGDRACGFPRPLYKGGGARPCPRHGSQRAAGCPLGCSGAWLTKAGKRAPPRSSSSLAWPGTGPLARSFMKDTTRHSRDERLRPRLPCLRLHGTRT
jgi:hypothetical protein